MCVKISRWAPGAFPPLAVVLLSVEQQLLMGDVCADPLASFDDDVVEEIDGVVEWTYASSKPSESR